MHFVYNNDVKYTMTTGIHCVLGGGLHTTDTGGTRLETVSPEGDVS